MTSAIDASKERLEVVSLHLVLVAAKMGNEVVI